MHALGTRKKGMHSCINSGEPTIGDHLAVYRTVLPMLPGLCKSCNWLSISFVEVPWELSFGNDRDSPCPCPTMQFCMLEGARKKSMRDEAPREPGFRRGRVQLDASHRKTLSLIRSWPSGCLRGYQQYFCKAAI